MKEHGLFGELIKISTGDATEELRGKIKERRQENMQTPKTTPRANAAWTVAKMTGAAIFIYIFFVLIMHSFYLTVFVTALWIAIFRHDGMKRHSRLAKPEQENNKIYIGRAFRHHVEEYASLGQSAQNQRGGATTLPIEVGTDQDHYIDYLNEPNPHVLILGSTSSGKTTTMRTFISRACIASGVKILLLDWNGESEDWARKTNATFWKVPEHLKVNPFRLNGMTKEARASVATENLVIAGHLTPLQSTKLKGTLLGFYLNGREPTLFEVWRAICSGQKNELVGHRLRAIQRVIGSEPDEFWKRIFTGNNVISLAGLNNSEKSLVAYAIMQRLTELFEKNPGFGAKLKLLVVLDEAWQFLVGEKREFGLEMHEESLVEKIIREGRKYGFGIVISTQQVEDLPNVYINSSALVMLHYYRNIGFYNKKKFDLDPFELSYISSAAQGEMMLFDRGVNHEGQWWADYIKVMPLSEEEIAQLAGSTRQYTPKRIDEPELPIEEHQYTKPVAERRVVKTYTASFPIPIGAPSASEHAALLGILNAKEKTMSEIIGIIKERGWITSPATLYGYNGSKPGILDTVVKQGMAKRTFNSFELTEKGLNWVEPTRIIANQSDKLGSEHHKRLLIKTVEKLHESNTLVLTTNDKHSFDLLGYPVQAAKKWLWDARAVKGYEIQTSARPDSVEMNSGKARRWKIPLVWVSDDETILGEIRKQTGGRDGYLAIVDQ